MRKQFSQNSWFYALGGIGRDMAAAGLFLNYLLPYALVTKNLSQQAFLGLSGIMACGRLLEAVLDPLMGSVLDNTQTRWGPFKPWLLIGTLGTAITIVISFSNQWQGGAYLVAFSILYLGFDIFFTMNDVTYWAILPTLSSDQHERNWVTSLSALMAGVGAFLTNLLVPFLTIGSHAWGGNAITGYARVAVAFTFVLLFCQSLVLFGVHQHPMSRHKQRRAQQLWRQVYQTFRQNDQIRWNALLLLLYMGVNTCSTMVLPFYLYLRFGYSGLWPMIVTALGQVATAGLYLFFNRIANRYARKTLIHCATLLDVGGYAALLLLGLLVPPQFKGLGIGLIAIFNILPTLGNGLYLLVLVINIANTVEYQQWLTGERHEGILLSVRPLMTKIGMAVGQLSGMLIFQLTGTLALTQKIAKIERLSASNQLTPILKQQMITSVLQNGTGARVTGLLICWTLVPLFGIVGITWLADHHLTIDEKRYDSIRDALETTRHQSS